MKNLPKSAITEKSFALGLRIVRLARDLMHHQREYELGRQVLRSGTSVGANVVEAQGGISRADFSHKMSIAYKEALETKYWLNLLVQSELISQETFDETMEATDECSRILFKILESTGRITRGPKNQIQEEQSPYLSRMDFLFEDELTSNP